MRHPGKSVYAVLYYLLYTPAPTFSGLLALQQRELGPDDYDLLRLLDDGGAPAAFAAFAARSSSAAVVRLFVCSKLARGSLSLSSLYTDVYIRIKLVSIIFLFRPRFFAAAPLSRPAAVSTDPTFAFALTRCGYAYTYHSDVQRLTRLELRNAK